MLQERSTPGREPRREKGVLERIQRPDSLLRVERETMLKQVDEMVQIPAFGVVHARRCSHQPGS